MRRLRLPPLPVLPPAAMAVRATTRVISRAATVNHKADHRANHRANRKANHQASRNLKAVSPVTADTATTVSPLAKTTATAPRARRRHLPEPQRSAYPEQGGYDQGYQQGGGYGRQDYGSGEYTQYAETASPGGYAPQGGYGEPAGRDYDYGQPPASDYGQPAAPDYGQAAGGYGGYGQGGYGAAAAQVTLQLDDGSGRTYQLRDGSNVVGRGQDAQFRLPDTGVSRRHLEIRWDGQVALLSDLNSTNGTTVNNAPVQEWQLADGDVIRLGHSEIIVRIH